jgi:protein SCO1/2
MLRVLIVGLVLLAAATVWLSGARQTLPAPQLATVFDAPRILPDVELTDHLGRDFSTTQLNGQFSFLFFGFTHCPDICPITLKLLADAKADLLARGLQPPAVVFVSVDPQRDTPEQIERYLRGFDAEFLGVTGHAQALQPLLQQLGVYVQTHSRAGEAAYSVTHSTAVFLVGPEADLVAVFGAPNQAAIVASDYLRIRQRYFRDNPTPAGPI